MFKQLIRNIIKTELDATLLLKINELEYLMMEYDRQFVKLSKEVQEHKKYMEEYKEWCSDEYNRMNNTRHEFDDHVAKMVNDTIIKLESYEEAALAMLKRK